MHPSAIYDGIIYPALYKEIIGRGRGGVLPVLHARGDDAPVGGGMVVRERAPVVVVNDSNTFHGVTNKTQLHRDVMSCTSDMTSLSLTHVWPTLFHLYFV